MRVIPIKRLFFQAGTLCGLIVLLTACGGSGNSAQARSTAIHSTPTHNATAPAASPSPSISPGPQACPTLVKDPTYWDPIIPTQPNVTQVQDVTCGYLKGVPTLQALVIVLHSDQSKTLDVYVYDNITGAAPVQIFKLQNLAAGSAKISGYNSVETAEVLQTANQSSNETTSNCSQDLCREFKWSDGAGTLVQVTFPGIFPDLTRYQAENDQAQVNQGQQSWKVSATMTAQAFGANLLQWNSNAPATLVSGGGTHDTQAVVSLKNTSPGGNALTITLSRLEGNANGRIWIVTDVETSGLTITQPQTGSIIHSPLKVTGTGNAFEGIIGKVTVLNHLDTAIGSAEVHGASGNGSTTFSTSVTAQPTIPYDAEEGLVMLTESSNANGGVAGAVIVKVLIQK
ncbi:MAG TPA: Gmad2 immunoglobulin-like domain-containing protein [Ktedonobacteraceae bacterium]